MSINFSGLASGMDTNSIITQLLAVEQQPLQVLAQRKNTIVAQQSQYSAVSSRIRDVQTSLSKLSDAKLGSIFDLFETKKSTSSGDTKVTASVTNSAVKGSFTVEVDNLATATRASSTSDVGKYTSAADAVSNVSQGTITGGNFTVYINNTPVTIAVDTDTDTMNDVVDRIATEITNVTGQAASGSLTADGKIQLSYNAGTTLSFGANGDTSNFAKVTHLSTGSANGGLDTFTSSYGTSTIDLGEPLVGNAANLQNNTISAGTITIGKETFTVDATTTLTDLISKVNSSNAGVLMSYNATTNRVEMTSKTTGNQAITLNDNGTNVLSSLGLVNGADTLSTQTLGQNAKFRINGGIQLQSTSNTVDSSVHSLSGVSLNLLAGTSGVPVTINVDQDTDVITSAIGDMVDDINTAISFIDEQTKKGATLNGENPLTRLRTQLRSQMSDAISTLTKYKTLSQVGISTGSVNTSPGTSSASSKFQFNKTALIEAMSDNINEVKALFIGDGTHDGIVNKLEKIVDGALDPEYGIFSSRDASANQQIKDINDAITRGQARLDTKETQLRAQFTAMEQMITQYQQQGSALSSLK